MSYPNGQLPASALAPIPGGRLSKPAALRWNALCVRARADGHRTPMPNGPDSTYRTRSRQVFWRAWWCARGACGNAAVPGTSNHGKGIAVDTNDGDVVDRYPAYGWAKRYSDAPWEPWHRRWAGFGPVADAVGWAPVIRRGSRGPAVYRAQTYIRNKIGFPHRRSTTFGPLTEQAVRKFQRSRGLKADGVIGAATWKALRKRNPRRPRRPA